MKKFAAACLLFLSACVVSPLNNQTICETSSVVAFSGYASQPNATLNLLNWNHIYNTWDTFATATSSASPLNISGTNLYPWNISTRVAIWHWQGGGIRTSQVKVQEVGGSLSELVTYDSNPLTCISTSSDPNFFTAAWGCRSAQSPVLHLYAQQVNLSCSCQFNCH